MASMLHSPATFAGKLACGTSASDLLQSSSSGVSGVPLKGIGRARFGTSKRDFTVSAKTRKARKRYWWPEDPDPNVKGGIFRHLSSFPPLKEKPKPVTLDFEKPLMVIQKKLFDIQKLANETGLDFSDQIMALENNYQQALRNLYTNLTPFQRLQIARHPNRPTFLDHVFNITETFIELHGDRAGYDDPAIVTGLGTMNGKTYMLIGHQKGRNTKENIMRNFGMPTPHGYRKALRLMKYADHHGFPIVTFIDTPGAYADLKSEELGQGEAIAQNLRSMFGLKVPVISIVIGEGGSGGALAIGCGNKLLMLENSVFYVASPEACAAILWKSSKEAPKAAEKLKITAKELCKLQIADSIIPEPLGGAHTDPEWTSEQIKTAILEAMDELGEMEIPDLLQHRHQKFRKIGGFQEVEPIGPKINYNSKDRANPIIEKPVGESSKLDLKVDYKKCTLKLPNAESLCKCVPGLAAKVQLLGYLMMVKDLEKAIILESSEAAKMGFNDKIAKLREEYERKRNSGIPPALEQKLNGLTYEFWEMLSGSPNFKSLESKISMLRDLANNENIKKTGGFMQEVTEKVGEVLNRPDMKKKREEVESLMKKLRVTDLNSEKLDQGLEDKIGQLDQQLATETNYLIPYHVLIELLKGTPEDKFGKETGAFYKGYLEKYNAIINQPGKEKKSGHQINEEISDIFYSLGLRALLKKVRGDREASELISELTQKFEAILNRPDIRKKNESLYQFNKMGSAQSKELDSEMKEKLVKAEKDIVAEFAKVLNLLGLGELLDEKLDVEQLLKDDKEFKNGSVIKEKIAI
ncbi:hypothetical protein LguiB_015566 [Lonicera macranthoides]